MKKFISVLFAIFAFTMPAIACESNEIDTGSACVESKFSVTTSETDVFKFTMSASGTFYVDCGNGGTLSSSADDVTDKKVVRNNTDGATYTCTWQSADSQTIHFAGLATGYNTSSGCIVFGTRTPNNSVLRPDLITSISGSLGEIFKSYSRDKTRFPHFLQLFANAVNLTSLPGNLFSGVWVSEFNFAFEYTGLIEIPENLFSDLSGQPVNGAFGNVFGGCRNLQNIPENLFKSVPYLSYSLFNGAFNGCRSLTSIPSGLFSHIKDSTSATTNGNAFYSTFSECYNLTSLPEDLFASVTRVEPGTFNHTFGSNYRIKGYVPPSMFRGLIESGTGAWSAVWTDTFSGTGLDSTCPSGTTQYTTGFEDYWGGKVSCVEDAPHVCSAGEYLPKMYNSCAACPAGKYCTGGTYSFSASITQGLSGNISAGYFGNGGTKTATPTSEDCLSGYICGTCQGQTGFNGRPLYTNAGGGASECSECPAVSYELISRFTGRYGYYPSTRSSGIGGCLANFYDSDDAATFTTTCYHSTETYGDSTSQCHTHAPTACAAGKYNTITQTPEWRFAGDNAATCNGVDCMKGRICTDADSGYYSPEGALTQTICPNGTYSPSGSAVCYPHILHVGDSNVYLKSTKQTTPSLNIKISNDVFYANMTTERTKMNKDSSRYLHINLNDIHYYVCDDTTCPQ